MQIRVYVVKRKVRERRTYWLRWKNADGKTEWEATGLRDRSKAEHLRAQKWNELNGLQRAPLPEVTWDEATNRLRTAMLADNLRPETVRSYLVAVGVLRRAFPDTPGPAAINQRMAQKFKEDRSSNIAPWSLKSDLSTLKAVFRKWWIQTCGILRESPFADVRLPAVDEPDKRIISPKEFAELLTWLDDRWPGWKLPIVYLRAKHFLGWRATELASLRTNDLTPDCYVRVIALNSKTRKEKVGRLPQELHDALLTLGADGYAFGRFSAELRLQRLAKGEAHHAARIKTTFHPQRLVGWLDDELHRYFEAVEAKADDEGRPAPERFTLHDFRKTAITEMQLAGVSEQECSMLVGATPDVIRRHYAALERRTIADRIRDRRLAGKSVVA